MNKSLEQLRAEIRAEALRDYQRGDRLKDIALRYGVSTTAISLWALWSGLPRRKRGKWAKDWPDARDIEIVQAVRSIVNGKPTYKQIGAMFGNMSRAGIHRVYAKWKDWKLRCRFKKGEVIRYEGRYFKMIEPGIFGGVVQNMETGEKTYLVWSQPETRIARSVVKVSKNLPLQTYPKRLPTAKSIG
jgi:hypothetical protein